MVIVAALAAMPAAFVVTTGVTEATCTAVLLLMPLTVTTAVRLPAVGFVEKETVSDVAVEPVTVPTAPLLNTTVLLPGVVLKPAPLIVIVAALAAREAVLAVMAGETVATCTAVPLLAPPVVTEAMRLPEAGGVVKVTVSEVAVADVTVPTAGPLKVTVLPDAVGLNPEPLIVIVAVLATRPEVLLVRTGETAATCTGEPLLTPSVVTTAVRRPAVGLVEKLTVSEVAVADWTVPTAPLLNKTELLPAVVSKPLPLMTIVPAFAASWYEGLATTTGVIAATSTPVPLLAPSR